MKDSEELLAKWLHENRGCGANCGKCMCLLERKFRALDPETRKSLVSGLCSYSVDQLSESWRVFDDGNDPPQLCILPLLSSAEYLEFLNSVTVQGPFEAVDAWKIVHASWSNICTWPSKRHFRPQYVRKAEEALNYFHWHPPLAPVLIPSLLGKSPSESEILNLIGYFRPVAYHYPELRMLLPQWDEEWDRLRREERERWESEIQQSKLRRREEAEEFARRAAEIEALGLVAGLKKIIDDWPISGDLFLSSWLTLTSDVLDSLPDTLVVELNHICSGLSRNSSWKKFLRQIHHRRRVHFYGKRSDERWDRLCKLGELQLIERLEEIATSELPLTYYPQSWAAGIMKDVAKIPEDLGKKLVTRCTRLRRCSQWLILRRTLLHR